MKPVSRKQSSPVSLFIHSDSRNRRGTDTLGKVWLWKRVEEFDGFGGRLKKIELRGLL